eukprot:1344527-Amorphochlora_amoeboformis.AAC.1
MSRQYNDDVLERLATCARTPLDWSHTFLIPGSRRNCSRSESSLHTVSSGHAAVAYHIRRQVGDVILVDVGQTGRCGGVLGYYRSAAAATDRRSKCFLVNSSQLPTSKVDSCIFHTPLLLSFSLTPLARHRRPWEWARASSFRVIYDATPCTNSTMPSTPKTVSFKDTLGSTNGRQ